jgi:hypothetical protein
MRRIIRWLAPVVTAACVLIVPVAAYAGTPVEEGVKYLKKVQEGESPSGAPAFGGDWALTSFAAAGTAAAEVQRGTGASKKYAREWYENYIDPSTWPGEVENPATEFEKAALVSYAAGIDPARVSVERNLPAQIISEYQTSNPGYYGKPSVFEGTVFGVLALADTKTPETKVERIPRPLLLQSVEVIERNQHTDGGWNYEKAEGSEEINKAAGEPDTTGAAMAAICTSGVHNEGTEHALSHAEEYLKEILAANGSFNSGFGANADSNAWVVEGLNACGINASEFKKAPGDESPIKYLESLQITSAGSTKGGFRYEAGGSVNNYSSQDAVRALAGAGFTAEPPKPTRAGQEKWNAASKFSTAHASPLVLIINNGSSLKVCSVKVKAESTGEESAISLLKVLEKAKAGTEVKPAGCVSSYEPTSGSGAITNINGTTGAWKVSLDGGSEAEAKLSSEIKLGDVIYLNG